MFCKKQKCSVKTVFLKFRAKFIRKHLCRSLVFGYVGLLFCRLTAVSNIGCFSQSLMTRNLVNIFFTVRKFSMNFWIMMCQKQPPRGVPRKGCYESMQQVCRRAPMPIGVTLWHGCSPVDLLHIFRTLFTKNTS